jgi:hypothetical protein
MAFGCSRQVLRSLPAECVHVVATSSPYWGLRAYSAEAKPEEIGREKTPAEYVDAMVDVGRAVRHVLRADGVWILNLGDTYGGAPGISDKNLLLIPFRVALALQADGWIVRSAVPWIKGNCMPESVTDRLTVAHETVFVLVQSKRYFWDADAVRVPHVRAWDERNGGTMGRPPCGTKEALRIGKGENHHGPYPLPHPLGRNLRTSDIWLAGLDSLEEQLEAYLAHVRALRAQKGLLTDPEGHAAGLLVNPVPYSGAHFAAYPPRLIAPLIRAATSERGCCPHCGAQWVREVEIAGETARDRAARMGETKNTDYPGRSATFGARQGLNHKGNHDSSRRRVTAAWSPSCPCPAHEPIPPIVLDPFGGSGTTSQVARALGLRSILVDLYEQNAPLIRERMAAELDPAELKPIPRPEPPKEDERQLRLVM